MIEFAARVARRMARLPSNRLTFRICQFVPPFGFLSVLPLLAIEDQYRRVAVCRALAIISPSYREPKMALQLFGWYASLWARIIPSRSTQIVAILVRIYSTPRMRVGGLIDELVVAEGNGRDDEIYHEPDLWLAVADSAFESGLYKQALSAYQRVAEVEPARLRDDGAGLRASHAAGLRARPDVALVYFCHFYGFNRTAAFQDVAAYRVELHEFATIRTFGGIPGIALYFQTIRDHPNGKRIGIFYLSSTQALGHAILDPYYFLAENRDQYDRFIFLGPPKSAYRSGSATCLKLVEQYGEYVEVSDNFLLNASWMTFERQETSPFTLHFDHYWSLLRAAVKRDRQPNDDFLHNAWHMCVPPDIRRLGERFARLRRIPVDAPMVVIHARHRTYHKLAQQSFRDVDIQAYQPGIERLLKLGYVVLRIGDAAMPRLKRFDNDKNYFELPFLDGYRTDLDPFFIAHARFMIGCQSGPCAYARALGVPLLSINAVLHYTLLPAVREMACFKRYERFDSRMERSYPISEIEALEAGVAHLDFSHHFEEAGIRVRNARANEIASAIEDMIAWLDDPELPETQEQTSFREAVQRYNDRLATDPDALRVPLADYLGIALPGYRIAPSVARARLREMNGASKDHAG